MPRQHPNLRRRPQSNQKARHHWVLLVGGPDFKQTFSFCFEIFSWRQVARSWVPLGRYLEIFMSAVKGGNEDHG